MEFSIGNIITLLITVVVLAVYRQLDRNNRSLEKVKRYSDKIKAELDAFVDGKTVEVKNLAIELDVHQQTGKEILKRISNIEEGLGHRAADVEMLFEKVADYDSSLKELSDMTGQVEENLKRLHEESEFVDKVGKRIKETGVRILQLENRIPEIEKNFAKQNSRELQTVAGDVLQKTRKIATNIHEDVSQSEVRVKEFAGHLAKLEARRDGLSEETIETIRQAFDEQIYRAENEGEKLRERIEEDFSGVLDRSSKDAAQLEDSLVVEYDKIRESLSEAEKSMADMAAGFQAKIMEIEKEYQVSLKQAAARGRSLEDEAFTVLKGNIESRTNETRKELSALASDVEEQGKVIREKLDFMETRYNEKMQESETHIGSRFSEIENKVSEYEQEVAYRFGKVEEVSADIDSLEKNLRQAMERVTVRIKEDFSVFENDLESQRAEERKKAETDMQAIRNTMGEIEAELNELKTKAYENVSQKLQIFEEDFFSDLKARNLKIQEQLEQWQLEINQKLDDLGTSGDNERQKVEKDYAEELKNRLVEFQNKIYSQHEKFEDQVSSFQERINERMTQTASALTGVEDSLKDNISDIKDSSKAFFQKEFTDFNTAVGNQIKKQERDAEGRLKELEESIDIRHKELFGVMETAQSDVTVWQARVLQQMKESESEMGTQYDVFKKEAAETITVIKSDFSSQRDDLILATQEERARLKNELKEISDGVLTLETDLRKKTETAFDNFNREYENFMLEIQKKNRDMQVDLDRRIKEFRSVAQDTKDRTEQLQRKLFGKIEENHNTLSVNLQEIDKRLKGFIAQTKIFDRADSMKIALQEGVEDLKTEITRLEGQSNEIREIERKFLTMKKLGEDASVKLTRFLSEKRRIEEMEGDFKKLINISQAIDVKLDQVTSSHDDLQSIQARIRQLEELGKEVEQKYERLEKRKHVLETTSDGVNQNFQHLEDMELKVREMEDRLETLPGQVEEISRQVDTLSKNKKKADQAAKQLEEIDRLLTEIEERIEAMHKAREWLARTETRLEEIGKQAQEQVKLLGSILKQSGKTQDKEKGAPPMGAREVVTRLAHQGWSVEEITRATKLSRGEVELILELLPKS